MLIGIDLDEVIAEFLKGAINFYNDKYGKDSSIDDFKTYNLWKTWGMTREEAMDIIYDYHDSEYFDNMGIVPGALEGINFLARAHGLVIPTARQNDFKEKTERYIDRHFPGKFQGIYHGNSFSRSEEPRIKKADMCLDLGVDLLIDDSLHNARGCAEKGIPVLLFDAGYKWNQYEGDLPLVQRVKSWPEALEIITSYDVIS